MKCCSYIPHPTASGSTKGTRTIGPPKGRIKKKNFDRILYFGKWNSLEMKMDLTIEDFCYIQLHLRGNNYRKFSNWERPTHCPYPLPHINVPTVWLLKSRTTIANRDKLFHLGIHDFFSSYALRYWNQSAATLLTYKYIKSTHKLRYININDNRWVIL